MNVNYNSLDKFVEVIACTMQECDRLESLEDKWEEEKEIYLKIIHELKKENTKLKEQVNHLKNKSQ